MHICCLSPETPETEEYQIQTSDRCLSQKDGNESGLTQSPIHSAVAQLKACRLTKFLFITDGLRRKLSC